MQYLQLNLFQTLQQDLTAKNFGISGVLGNFYIFVTLLRPRETKSWWFQDFQEFLSLTFSFPVQRSYNSCFWDCLHPAYCWAASTGCCVRSGIGWWCCTQFVNLRSFRNFSPTQSHFLLAFTLLFIWKKGLAILIYIWKIQKYPINQKI